MTALQITMTTTEARQVTFRIKLLLQSMADQIDKIATLVQQARDGDVWRTLGYSSWPAYLAGEFSDEFAHLERAIKRDAIRLLSAEGVSTRAIASMVGLGKSTADRDIAQVSQVGTPAAPRPCGDCNGTVDLPSTTCMNSGHVGGGLLGKIHGTDGKQYTRRAKPASDDAPPVRPKLRRSSYPDAYRRAIFDLDKVVRRLEKLHADDRFLQHQKELKKRYSPLLEEIDAVASDLNEDVFEPNTCKECGGRRLPSRHFDMECANCRDGGGSR